MGMPLRARAANFRWRRVDGVGFAVAERRTRQPIHGGSIVHVLSSSEIDSVSGGVEATDAADSLGSAETAGSAVTLDASPPAASASVITQLAGMGHHVSVRPI
jgi:hypothetical protein